MGGVFHQTIANDYESLTALAEAITANSKKNGLSKLVSYQLDLAVEELITNIIKYGFDDDNSHQIDVSVTIAPEGAVTLTLQDDGHYFNPTEMAQCKMKTHDRAANADNIEEMNVGGWGLSLVRQNARAFTYERRDGRNCTAVTF